VIAPDNGEELAFGWWDALLDYWFGTLKRQDWFAADDGVDRVLRKHFLGLHEKLAAMPLEAGEMSDRQILAAVLALDQLPRNLFRGTPKAFATDAAARRLARAAVDLGYDHAMSRDERAFLYLPFEHSERLEDQDRAVDLISALGDPEYTRYAIAHRSVIARFGRFPHRNGILGRVSTPEEVAFLKQPGSSF